MSVHYCPRYPCPVCQPACPTCGGSGVAPWYWQPPVYPRPKLPPRKRFDYMCDAIRTAQGVLGGQAG